MKKQAFQDEINALPVYDTHTHLQGAALSARSFWDIGHYFWFIRELQAAGYPDDPMALSPARRIKAFWAAFETTRNTSMNWVVRRILTDLYGLELKSESDILTADEAIRSSARDPDWPSAICQKENIRRIVTNAPGDVPFIGIPEIGRLLPRPEGQIRDWMGQVERAADQRSELTAVTDDIRSTIGDLAGRRPHRNHDIE
jgi:glucuronate isomerase